MAKSRTRAATLPTADLAVRTLALSLLPIIGLLLLIRP
jgi:hypothetical protein